MMPFGSLAGNRRATLMVAGGGNAAAGFDALALVVAPAARPAAAAVGAVVPATARRVASAQAKAQSNGRAGARLRDHRS